MATELDKATKVIATRFPDVKLATIKRYLVFVVTTLIVFSAAYYTLMDQSIKYTSAINAEFKQLTDRHNKDPTGHAPKLSVPEPPAGWLYLGDGKTLDQAKSDHDIFSALYFSLSVQSTLGPPHYPPNRAWKLLTGVHILFVLTAGVIAIV